MLMEILRFAHIVPMSFGRMTENWKTKTANTTALNHCVDCNHVKQSRRLTKSQLEGGGSQILFVA